MRTQSKGAFEGRSSGGHLSLCIPYLCIYVSMYLGIYVSMYLCIHVYLSRYLCICISMYLCIYAYVCLCIYLSIVTVPPPASMSLLSAPSRMLRNLWNSSNNNKQTTKTNNLLNSSELLSVLLRCRLDRSES